VDDISTFFGIESALVSKKRVGCAKSTLIAPVSGFEGQGDVQIMSAVNPQVTMRGRTAIVNSLF